ncbi:MAG: SAM-dependent methyltransferase [Clostridia bacterium]|nr:SAM-dependent methyltransferase [Clostridia bacterium]
MTRRLEIICSHLFSCNVFADIGCDHGYCTQFMFRKALCKKAYISDISAGSLQKAAHLLEKEVKEGSCIPIVANGLEGIPEPCDLALIAGMGGEEIISILEKFPLPEAFVLQPMKNSEKVRSFLIGRGASIDRDYTFEDGGKFYDLIVGRAVGGDEYDAFELRYGRDNLKSPTQAFLNKLRHDQKNYRTALSAPNLSGARREDVLKKLYESEVITDAIENDL